MLIWFRLAILWKFIFFKGFRIVCDCICGNRSKNSYPQLIINIAFKKFDYCFVKLKFLISSKERPVTVAILSIDISSVFKRFNAALLIPYLKRFWRWLHLIRVQKSSFKEIYMTQLYDCYTEIPFHSCFYKVRLIRLVPPNEEIEVPLTNWGRRAFPKTAFIEFYAIRLGIETNYNTIR